MSVSEMKAAGASQKLVDAVAGSGISISDFWTLLSKIATFVPWAAIWALEPQIVAILTDGTKSVSQKLIAIFELVMGSFVPPPTPPVPTP